MAAPVIVKFPADVRVTNIDFVNLLVGGELITGTTVAASVPAGLTVSVAAAAGTLVPLTVGAGTDKQSYGVAVQVTTDAAHTYTINVAVVVNSDIAINYQNNNTEAFNALVGELEAGEAALGHAAFLMPDGFDAIGGQVRWEIINSDGVVIGNGQAFDYQISAPSSGVKIEAQAVVNVPSDTLPTLSGQSYQIRWTLTVNGQPYYLLESLRVTAPNTVPEGVEDVVELVGNDIPVSVVFAKPYDTVNVTVYQGNSALGNPIPVPQGTKTADGWFYSTEIVGLDIPAALEAYTLVWSAKNLSNPYTERQTGRMFVVSPSILSAAEDMRLTLNRSRTTIAHQQDLLFTVPLLIAYLRRGRDAFNGAYGVMTAFTFTAASGPLREYWLKFAEIQALRAQYLAEGEKVFNYSGAETQLDRDVTQYYDTMASNLQALLDNECKPFKTLLIKRGILNGDGDVPDLTRQRPGAAGAVGITLTPASNYGPMGRYRRGF